MKKSEWGNAVWLLFHTLSYKLRHEYSSETVILFKHIKLICNNLPCPDCQQHAVKILSKSNSNIITASKDSLIQFLFSFHNIVNSHTKHAIFPKELLDIYNNANTRNVVDNFIKIMSSNMNNNNLMMDSFRRQNYMQTFIAYINNNSFKYDA